LVMLGCYLLMDKANLPMNYIIIAFGTFIIVSMSLINKVYHKKIYAPK